MILSPKRFSIGLLTKACIMRKLFFHLLPVIFLIFSACSKNDHQPGDNDPATVEFIHKAYSWLDARKTSAYPERNVRIDHLKEHLNAGGVRLELLNEQQRLAVIPLKQGFESVNNKGKAPVSYLVLVVAGEEIIKGNIIQYLPEEEGKPLPLYTFSKIFNHELLEVNGKFTILTISDRFLYELNFKQGKLNSVAVMQSKSEAAGRTNRCTDWFLITTYYYSDGTTVVTEEYLGRSCSVDCGPSAPGGSIGGNCVPEADGAVNIEYEYEVSKDVSWIVSEHVDGYWQVRSFEKLKGRKYTNGTQSHFTGITHSNDAIFRMVACTARPVTWERLALDVGISPLGSLAHSTISGKVGECNGTDTFIDNKTKLWVAVNEFP